MNFFTADLHFGHSKIIKLCNRPFESMDDMNEKLIANWNSVVTGNDTVYIVGDLFYKCAEPGNILKRLKGKKILITGNHDAGWTEKEELTKYFKLITPLFNTYIDGRHVTLCHYPMLEWKGSHKSGTAAQSYLVHGHIHNKVKSIYRFLYECEYALNAGADINGFAPVTFEQLVKNNAAYKLSVLNGGSL